MGLYVALKVKLAAKESYCGDDEMYTEGSYIVADGIVWLQGSRGSKKITLKEIK